MLGWYFSFVVSFYLFLTYLFIGFGGKFEKNSFLVGHKMVRSRLPLDLIPKEKSRKITFQNRLAFKGGVLDYQKLKTSFVYIIWGWAKVYIDMESKSLIGFLEWLASK